MIRSAPLLAAPLLLALLLAAPVAALAAVPRKPAVAAVADWSNKLAITPQGGILLGNPNAPVKLVEYGSLTCPHCRAFHETGLPGVRARGLSAGRISYEYRPFSLNGIDLMAGLLLQCQPAQAAWAFVNRVYARQDELARGFQAIPETERPRITALPPEQQGPALAELGKLPEFAAAAGIPRAKYDACLVAKPGMDRLMAIRAEAITTHKVTGTPSFLINGTLQPDVYDWSALEPLLIAAVKAAPQRTK
jgi:protein-disulfide isomerase